MSSFIALDWERNRVHLIAATATRGKVRIDKALVWEESEEITSANAEAAGQRLRERLREAKIAPAPLLVCLGRERVIFKEIGYPNVAAAEEPAIVRFQANKELTEPAESVVIDYAPLETRGRGGERRALLLVARRLLINAYASLSRAAGLKLLAITPRPFGIAACVEESLGASRAGRNVAAVLNVSERWAEFLVVHGGRLLFARPVPADGKLLQEVRRNLLLYAGQSQANSEGDAVASLYVADEAGHGLLRELEETLAVPVQALDPLAGQEGIDPQDRPGFTGVVGLVHAWAKSDQLPVNVIAPKEPKPPVNTSRQTLVTAGGVGVLLLLVMFFLGQMMMNSKAAEIDEIRAEIEATESRLNKLQPESKQFASVHEWDRTALSVIDEIYDLSVRFPYREGLRVEQLTLAPVPTPNPKERFPVRMTVTGTVPKSEVHLVQQLLDDINRDKEYRRAALVSLRGKSGDSSALTEEFVVRVDIGRRPPAEYVMQLEPAQTQTQAPKTEAKSSPKTPVFSKRPFAGGRP